MSTPTPARTGTDAAFTADVDIGAVEKYLSRRRKVTRDELQTLLSLAREHGGELVDVSARGDQRDPDDWCGTMWFRKPRPRVGALVDALVDRGWGVEIFPIGIINPELAVRVRNQAQGL